MEGENDELKKEIEPMRNENDELKKENDELKKEIKFLKNEYVAHRGDKTDEALSEYINNRPEDQQMKIMFLRESEGVYRFGQKRVYIKVEKGDQIFVRVGGGFMYIEEFINTYQLTEAEKVERHDVVKRFQDKLSI